MSSNKNIILQQLGQSTICNSCKQCNYNNITMASLEILYSVSMYHQKRKHPKNEQVYYFIRRNPVPETFDFRKIITWKTSDNDYEQGP